MSEFQCKVSLKEKKVVQFWIGDYSNGVPSALKVEATPNSTKFTCYNNKHRNGEIVEGMYFGQIMVGINLEYKIVKEDEFLKFIENIQE